MVKINVMTEQELIDAGFEKFVEENSGEPFYYYLWEPYERSSFGLISPANDEVKDNFWKIYMFDDESIVFSDIKEIQILIDIIKRNTKIK